MGGITIGTRITQGEYSYLVDGFIGEGGFGRVFHATRHAPDPGEVAVKVPADHVQQDAVWSLKFLREARILANVSHDNVVKIVHTWRFPDDGTVAFATEFVKDAKSLDDAFKDPLVDQPSLFLQALYGLREIHRQTIGGKNSVVHRDISPKNLLVTPGGVLKIIDFGLAKEDPRVTKVLTHAGMSFGTPGCMAPEQQIDAASVDHRADLYALGRSFAAAIQQRKPEFVELVFLPEPWKEICRKLSAFNTADRHANADEAISHAFKVFAAANFPPHNFHRHVLEVNSWWVEALTPVIPDGWPELCNSYFKSRAVTNPW